MSSSKVFNCHYNLITSQYPDKYFDLLVDDIPYGINVGEMAFLKERKTTVKQKNGTRLNPNKSKKHHTFKDWDLKPPAQDYFDEVRRVSKHQIIFGVDYVNWEGLGTGRIKWDKGFSEEVSFNRYETAYCSLIDTVVELPLLWAGMQQAASLSAPMVQQGNKKLNEKRIHPCHKPVLLYKKLFLDYGFRGMKVLDTHLGGGSSRIAADMFDCEFVGCEIDEEYYSDHLKRWNQYRSQQKIVFK